MISVERPGRHNRAWIRRSCGPLINHADAVGAFDLVDVAEGTGLHDEVVLCSNFEDCTVIDVDVSLWNDVIRIRRRVVVAPNVIADVEEGGRSVVDPQDLKVPAAGTVDTGDGDKPVVILKSSGECRI